MLTCLKSRIICGATALILNNKLFQVWVSVPCYSSMLCLPVIGRMLNPIIHRCKARHSIYISICHQHSQLGIPEWRFKSANLSFTLRSPRMNLCCYNYHGPEIQDRRFLDYHHWVIFKLLKNNNKGFQCIHWLHLWIIVL